MADEAVPKDEKVEEIEEKAEPEAEVEEEAPVRKSASFYAQRRIIEKQSKKIEKLEKGEKEDEDLELTSSAKNLIREELSPVLEGLKKTSDDLELRQYLVDHPEHKKFEKAARKRLETWSNVPVEDIFKTLTYGTDTKAKVEKKEEAIVRAKSTALKGSSSRAEEPSLPSTQEDMKKLYDRVKKGRETIKLGE